MSRRLNRETTPAEARGFLAHGPTTYSMSLFVTCLRRCLVNDLSGHTDCCGSECKLFHLGSLLCNSLYRALEACTLLLLVVSVYTLSVETALNKCIVRSGVPWVVSSWGLLWLLFFPWLVQLGAWPGGSWLPSGCALVAVACLCWVVMMRLSRNGPPCLIVSPSHLRNGPCPN